jgi:hypothetical protein
MGSDDGDGGFQERADAESAKKGAARNQVNALFGAAPTAPVGPAPNRDLFNRDYTTVSGGETRNDDVQHSTYFDQSGYDKAMADYTDAMNLGGKAASNKAARDALYGTVRDNAFNAGKRTLDEANADAQRKTKFALFDRGLNGSSLQDDQNALLNRTYNQGLLDLGSKADQTKADLAGNDEGTRLGLLQSLDAGMDQGSAVSSALGQMKVNSDKAASTQLGANIGDLFAGSGALYTQMQNNQAQERARNDFRNQYGSLFAGAGQPIVTKTY